MQQTKKILGVLFLGSLAAEIAYYALNYAWKKFFKSDSRSMSKSPRKAIHTILFFPDSKLACQVHYSNPEGCLRSGCRYSHEDTSLSKLQTYLLSAKQSLDVCVFVITCRELADSLIKVHKRGVVVRVITDSKQVDVPNSQVGNLLKEGIQVRRDNNPSYLMHHKFVVIDKSVLVNGSFNWTRQAVMGNNENVLITNSPDIVEPYKQEFEWLWGHFDPQFYPQTTFRDE